MRLLLVVSALIAPFACQAAAAADASPWAREDASSLRLIDGGAAAGGRLAAIEIRLEPGWKTYWRQPGVSGVPPRFDFSGSGNLASATVVFPTPERFDDGGGVTNVYHGSIVLPVAVTPRDPARPVDLRLVADYGVCDAVCVPVRAEAELDLAIDGAPSREIADEVQAAAAGAPKPQPLGASAPLAVSSVRRAPAADGSAVEIEVAAPEGGPAPTLFAETGDGDFAPAPEPSGAFAGGRARFRIAFDEPEPPKTGLRLTLAAGDRAIETAVGLDDIRPAP